MGAEDDADGLVREEVVLEVDGGVEEGSSGKFEEDV